MQSINQDLEALERSPLLPAQRLDAVRTFVDTQLVFPLRASWVSRTRLLKLERSIRNRVRKWLSVPKHSLTQALYLPTSLGGTGITDIPTLYLQQTLTQTLRMLNSNEPAVRHAARALCPGESRVGSRQPEQPPNIQSPRIAVGTYCVTSLTGKISGQQLLQQHVPSRSA